MLPILPNDFVLRLPHPIVPIPTTVVTAVNSTESSFLLYVFSFFFRPVASFTSDLTFPMNFATNLFAVLA